MTAIKKKVYDYYKNGDFVTRGTVKQIANQQDKDEMSIRQQAQQFAHIHRLIHVGYISPIVEVYEYDDLLYRGTRRQLLEVYGIKKTRLDHWKTGRRRGYTVKVTDERIFEPLTFEEIEAQKMKMRIRKEEKQKEGASAKKQQPRRSKKFIKRKVKPRAFRFSDPWINYQIRGMFKGWNTDGETG